MARKAIRTDDWQRLANAMRDSRERADLTRPAFAVASGVSESTVYDVEHAREWPRGITASIRRMAYTLGWPDGWVEAVVEGRQKYAPEVPSRPGPSSLRTGTPEELHSGRTDIEALSEWIGRGGMPYRKIPTSEILRLISTLTAILAERQADANEPANSGPLAP